jgi:tRNA (guanine9-N1)-methyltransferase
VCASNSEAANTDATETNVLDARDDESPASQNFEDAGAQLPSASPMSKNQIKKLRKEEEWDAGRKYRKKMKKQKIAERRMRCERGS